MIGRPMSLREALLAIRAEADLGDMTEARLAELNLLLSAIEYAMEAMN